jgi:hypothetical protein
MLSDHSECTGNTQNALEAFRTCSDYTGKHLNMREKYLDRSLNTCQAPILDVEALETRRMHPEYVLKALRIH